MILFQNNKPEIFKMIYLIDRNFYSYKPDTQNLLLSIESKYGKKNLLIFKNTMTTIKYKKYQNIVIKFEKLDIFNEIVNVIN
jgi:hypothetical protein